MSPSATKNCWENQKNTGSHRTSQIDRGVTSHCATCIKLSRTYHQIKWTSVTFAYCIDSECQFNTANICFSLPLIILCTIDLKKMFCNGDNKLCGHHSKTHTAFSSQTFSLWWTVNNCLPVIPLHLPVPLQPTVGDTKTPLIPCTTQKHSVSFHNMEMHEEIVLRL